MFELFACLAIALLVFGLIFYQNFAEKHRAQRMMRLIKRRRRRVMEEAAKPPADAAKPR